jgi:3-(3-hydroxy-phenyl)propionate hydroxylase
MPNAEVRLGAAVTSLSQNESQVTAMAGEERFAADYVIGADGGRSTVRKCLAIEFEGYTWPERFLVVTTKFDFAAALGCCTRNYMADPHEWTNLFKVAGDDLKGRWRAVFNTRAEETDEEALSDASVRARLGRIYVPEKDCDYVHLNLYNVHQRVAKHFRKGRAFLCGDAAHVNNPIGGLGLNSGIHEAWDLAHLLDRALRGKGDELDTYEARRRPLNIEYVQEQTIANKKRLEERDPAQRARRFQELRETMDDPARHKAFLMKASLLESARRASELTSSPPSAPRTRAPPTTTTSACASRRAPTSSDFPASRPSSIRSTTTAGTRPIHACSCRRWPREPGASASSPAP